MDIYSGIDSKRFNIKVGKINNEFLNNKGINEGISYLLDNKYELVIARMGFDNIEIINQLESYGFGIKDAQQTYYYNLKDFNITKLPKRDGSFIIRDFKVEDTSRMVKLARICFNNYGHYFANKRLKKNDCLDAYGDWAYNTCTNLNVADKILVAEKDGEVAGYLSFKTYDEGGKIYAAGGMGAVDPKHRGKGIFQDITIAGLEWGSEMGFHWEEHNVLINNDSVNSAFTRIGFKPSNVIITLHGWMDDINLD